MSDNTNDKNIYNDNELTPDETSLANNSDLSDTIPNETSENSEININEESDNSSDIVVNIYNNPADKQEDDISENTDNTDNINDTDNTENKSNSVVSNTVNNIKRTSNKNSGSNILKYLSYKISNVISDLKNAEPKKRLKIISMYSSCILLVVLIFTDIIPILPNAYNRFYVGNSYVIGETQGGIYDKIGKNIIYAGSGSIMSFGPDMSFKFKINSVVGTPKLETAGKNAVIYYRNSNEAVVISNNDKTENIEMKETITGATISKNGYYGFVTDEAGYKSCVNIFNPGGKSIYKWHTNNPVIDISVSDNGKNMTAASYTYESNAMSGKLVFFDINNKNPIKEVVTGSNVFSEVRYIHNDVVVAFGDMYTAAYTYKGVMKWRIDYGGRTLKSYDISDNGDIAFIFDRYSSELSESTVEIYNSSGRLNGKYESKDNIKYVSANNGYVLLSLDKQTILLDNDADVMKKRKTEKDFRKAVLYHNYNFAFSVSDSVAQILSVNH